jgi:hypothetical protein
MRLMSQLSGYGFCTVLSSGASEIIKFERLWCLEKVVSRYFLSSNRPNGRRLKLIEEKNYSKNNGSM